MRRFFFPAEAPPWLNRVLDSIRDALSDIWNTPLRLKDYPTTELPPAADWAQGLAYDVTVSAVKFSNGSSWGALFSGTVSAFGASLIDDADASAARTTLGLGTAALKNTGTSGDTVPLCNGSAVTWAAGASWAGTLTATGSGCRFGPSTGGAADNVIYMDCTNFGNNIEFWSHLGGASQQDGYFAVVRGAGFYINHTVKTQFRVGGSDIVAFPSTGIDLTSGKDIRVNGTTVVTARKTGWATATGSATRTTFDTTTVTTQQLAERVKALIDDLHGTAGHGLIGT